MAKFDLGSFDAPEATAEARGPEPELSWRLDPKDSHSDWTVVVRTDGQPDAKYHVHRCQLSVGPRRSDYFAAIFKTNMSEGASAESELVLQHSAAEAFPKLLDFVYSGRISHSAAEAFTKLLGFFGGVSFKSPTEATALLHLAHYLRMRALYDTTTAYIQSDLVPKNAPTYAAEAHKYSLDKLVEAAVTVCADNFGDFAKIKIFECEVPTELFTRMVEASLCGGEAKSVRIAQYCGASSKVATVDKELFQRLCETVDRVDPDSAVALLRQAVSRGICPGSGTKNVSDLCIRDASCSGPDDKPAHYISFDDKNYKPLPDTVKVKLLEAAITRAKTNHARYTVWDYKEDWRIATKAYPDRDPPTVYVKNRG